MPGKKKNKLITWAIIAAVLVVLLAAYAIPKLALIGKQTDHKVYVAFGFHGNLYHSYRVDTNDEAGFGKDIRVMRKIIVGETGDDPEQTDIDAVEADRMFSILMGEDVESRRAFIEQNAIHVKNLDV